MAAQAARFHSVLQLAIWGVFCQKFVALAPQSYVNDSGNGHVRTTVAVHFPRSTVIENGHLYPENKELVEEFLESPSNYPEIKLGFDQASQAMSEDFYKLMKTNVADLKKIDETKTLIRLAELLFFYGLAKEFAKKSHNRVTAANFYCAGAYPAMLFAGVLDLKQSLSAIKSLLGEYYSRSTKIGTVRDFGQAIFEGFPDDDTLGAINAFLNRSRLKLHVKDVRGPNKFVLSGPKSALKMLRSFLETGNKRRLFPRGDSGPFISGVEHTPLLGQEDWAPDLLSVLTFNPPKFPLIGQQNEDLTPKSFTPERARKFFEDALFAPMDTYGCFCRTVGGVDPHASQIAVIASRYDQKTVYAMTSQITENLFCLRSPDSVKLPLLPLAPQ